MKNVFLIGAVKDTLSEKVIDKVVKENVIDKIFLLVHQKADSDIYEKYGKCIYREDAVRGKYSVEDIDMMNCTPLDDTVFAYMAPHTLEILNQQRRFEEYHAFHISNVFEEHYTLYMHNLFFWYNFLESKHITHAFFACVPHEGYDSIIYYLCKMKNIPVKMIYNDLLPKRYYALSDFMHPEENLGEVYKNLLEEYKDKEEVPLNDEEEKLYEKWASLEPKKMKPWYMEGDPFKKRFATRFGITNVFSAWETTLNRIYAKYNYKMCGRFVGDCVKNIPTFINATFETYKRWIYARPVWKRTIELKKFYDSIAEMPVEGEKYIYYALHYQPEASSNPIGGREYSDQILPIHLLARSVPANMKVYVKEHPEQLAPFRSKEYYQDIKRIHNVRIIKASCSTYDLIQKAVAVSALTGTVCWEAQFFGIPAIIFGYSHKNLAPLSYNVRTYEECKNAVKDIQEKKKKTTKNELRIFIKAMYEESFAGKDNEHYFPLIIKEFLSE